MLQSFQKRYSFGDGDSMLASYGSDRTNLAFIDPAKNGKTRDAAKLRSSVVVRYSFRGPVLLLFTFLAAI